MKIFLIAEIGINHNGDINVAKKLIDASSDAGFDAVKFQKKNNNSSLHKRIFGWSKRKSLGQNPKRSKKWFGIWTKRI